MYKKELHNTTCSNCGKACKVPFKPVNLNILRSYPHPRGVSLRSPASLCFAVGHYTSKDSLSLNFVLLFEIYGWFTSACP